MNAKKSWKRHAFKLLAVMLFFGLLPTLVSYPVLAQGRNWYIEVIVQTENRIVEQNDFLILYFKIVDWKNGAQETVLMIVPIYRGDTAVRIRNRMISSINQFRQLQAKRTQVGEILAVEARDNYKGIGTSVEDISGWTRVKLSNGAYQVRIICWDP